MGESVGHRDLHGEPAAREHGASRGAIDLPVAKEPHTGFAVIPASSLKGVARDAFEAPAKGDDTKLKEVADIFGPSLTKAEEDIQKNAGEGLFAGALVFTEARLVAYAARSLNRPFVYVTCRLVLERLRRDLRAADKELSIAVPDLPGDAKGALVADKGLAGKTLVIEDMVYTPDRISISTDLGTIAENLGKLLPEAEGETRARLKKSLVLIPDNDFSALARKLPVRARIRLGENKTTSDDDGNLWYEEQVPSDCLFVSFIGARRGKRQFLEAFKKNSKAIAVTQIGGNETVGEGIVLWTIAGEEVVR
ncbi:MAG: type III-B CRISPR module RAMP protein Cmr4 [Byssovorax sp.]